MVLFLILLAALSVSALVYGAILGLLDEPLPDNNGEVSEDGELVILEYK